MSYDPQFDAPSYPEPRANNGGLFIGFLFGAGMLIAAGAYLFPVLHKQWNDADIAQKIRLREAEARAEAEMEFRKSEARLKAEAQAAAEKLIKLEIAPTAFKAVAEKAGPAVVNISNLQVTDQGMFKAGEGSGVVYKVEKDVDGLTVGYVVTNSHVVHKTGSPNPYALADRVGISFSSGRMIFVDSGMIYHDPYYDLAVIKFEAEDFDNLIVADWGNSSSSSVGDWVVAIGSPFGLKNSVTTGIISAGKGRTELRQVETEVLQTDAAINSGNSGGPLLDLKGRVIGINTAIATQSGGSNGVGFSIPSNTVKEVVEALLKPPHQIRRGYLGVRIGDIDPRIANKVGVSGGALIADVVPGHAADKAGIRSNDLVIRLKSRLKEMPVRTGDDLRSHVRELKPEDKVSLEIVRGITGRAANIEKHTLEVTLGELPRVEINDQPDQFRPRMVPPLIPRHRNR